MTEGKDIEIWVAIDEDFDFAVMQDREEAISECPGVARRVIKITIKNVTVISDTEVEIDCPPVSEAPVKGEAV